MDSNYYYDAETYKRLIEEEMLARRDTMYAAKESMTVDSVTRNPADHSISATIRVFEHAFNDERAFQVAVQAAVKETVAAIASVIINERRAEIEAACNFDDLRQDIAAQLAAQFMAMKFTGQPTLMDKPKPSPPLTMPASQAQAQMKSARITGLGGVPAGTKTP